MCRTVRMEENEACEMHGVWNIEMIQSVWGMHGFTHHHPLSGPCPVGTAFMKTKPTEICAGVYIKIRSSGNIGRDINFVQEEFLSGVGFHETQ